MYRSPWPVSPGDPARRIQGSLPATGCLVLPLAYPTPFPYRDHEIRIASAG
jgi:hypothetical protein